MEELLSHVSNLGFPIVITGYLLMRMEKKLDDLTNSITTLTHSIVDLDKRN
ncbi:MAG: YvrJ family protein [Tissierellia bacterium]|nr:YvrJ family protein [Tissierellia bacterium]